MRWPPAAEGAHRAGRNDGHPGLERDSGDGGLRGEVVRRCWMSRVCAAVKKRRDRFCRWCKAGYADRGVPVAHRGRGGTVRLSAQQPAVAQHRLHARPGTSLRPMTAFETGEQGTRHPCRGRAGAWPRGRSAGRDLPGALTRAGPATPDPAVPPAGRSGRTQPLAEAAGKMAMTHSGSLRGRLGPGHDAGRRATHHLPRRADHRAEDARG